MGALADVEARMSDVERGMLAVERVARLAEVVLEEHRAEKVGEPVVEDVPSFATALLVAAIRSDRARENLILLDGRYFDVVDGETAVVTCPCDYVPIIHGPGVDVCECGRGYLFTGSRLYGVRPLPEDVDDRELCEHKDFRVQLGHRPRCAQCGLQA